LFTDHPVNQALRNQFTEVMRKRLVKRQELLDDIVPDFSPNCRRLTPGPGYLEAIIEDNVDYIRTPIKRFAETGIETTDGTHREVDAVFTTNLSFPHSVQSTIATLKPSLDIQVLRRDYEAPFPQSL
jgi:cation diffusion facilitator CzcD-associated flavoprotein CzcO